MKKNERKKNDRINPKRDRESLNWRELKQSVKRKLGTKL